MILDHGRATVIPSSGKTWLAVNLTLDLLEISVLVEISTTKYIS